jgi:hypothetical protein
VSADRCGVANKGCLWLQETAELFHSTFAQLISTTLPLSKHPSKPDIAESLNPAAYAVRAEKISYTIENAVARTVRLCFSGGRDVYTVSGWAVSEFLAASSPDKRMPALKE